MSCPLLSGLLDTFKGDPRLRLTGFYDEELRLLDQLHRRLEHVPADLTHQRLRAFAMIGQLRRRLFDYATVLGVFSAVGDARQLVVALLDRHEMTAGGLCRLARSLGALVDEIGMSGVEINFAYSEANTSAIREQQVARYGQLVDAAIALVDQLNVHLAHEQQNLGVMGRMYGALLAQAEPRLAVRVQLVNELMGVTKENVEELWNINRRA